MGDNQQAQVYRETCITRIKYLTICDSFSTTDIHVELESSLEILQISPLGMKRSTKPNLSYHKDPRSTMHEAESDTKSLVIQ